MIFDYFIEDEDGEESQFGGGDSEVEGLGPANDGSFVVRRPAKGDGFDEQKPHEVVGISIGIADKRVGSLRRAFPEVTAMRMEVCAGYDVQSCDYDALFAWASGFLKPGSAGLIATRDS